MSGQRLNKVNLESLKKFQHHQKIKQIALTAIAVHLSAKDIAHIKEVFKSLDHNGDGNLNLEELREGISEMRNSDELIDLLSGADTDKNGTINYTGIKYLANLSLFIEFIAATIEAQVFLREENLRNAFIMFDRDGSGKIDAKELAQLLTGESFFKDELTKEQMIQLISEADINGDGEIDYEEFIYMMRKVVNLK